MAEAWNWRGLSGGAYNMNAYPIAERNWVDVSGIYILARHSYNSDFRPQALPLYIGQAVSFRNRFADHERFEEALCKGMTHVHAVPVLSPKERDAMEKELVAYWQPAMNVQLKSISSGMGLVAAALRARATPAPQPSLALRGLLGFGSVLPEPASPPARLGLLGLGSAPSAPAAIYGVFAGARQAPNSTARLAALLGTSSFGSNIAVLGGLPRK